MPFRSFLALASLSTMSRKNLLPSAIIQRTCLVSFLGISTLACQTFGQEVVEATANFPAEQIEFFETKIRPLLVEKCYHCHSTDAPELRGGLYVDSRLGLITGGDSGAAILPGHPSDSLLIDSVNYTSMEMPPDGKLKPEQITALTQWVEMGAPWPRVTSAPGTRPPSEKTDWSSFDWEAARKDHWAWQPIKRPSILDLTPVPNLNPIDQFVSARRNAANLTPNSLASPVILVRRIYNDLIGVLPTPAQVDAFVLSATEDHPRAVATLVDELLATPQYGQRWARHWLDVARFSDGRGGFMDNKPLDQAWRYRDWVVESFNKDLPIDEFIRLQIAGDLLAQSDQAIATGFFALGPTYQSDGGDPDSVAQARGETLDDRVDTLTRGLMGITGSCARCHDHKFDPIPQLDYYSLAGIFNNTAVHDRPLAPVEIVNQFNQHRQQVDALNKKINPLKNKLRQEKREPTLDEQESLDQWLPNLAELLANPPPGYETAHSLRDTGNVDMKVAIRGNLRKTGAVAPRRFLRLITAGNTETYQNGSGRIELADAIVHPENPLTTRVFVNRIWMHHFGAGLVSTPSNFGTLGEKPTHPELLDWLASEFVTDGWSLKSLHRKIMNSQTYQLSSENNQEAFRRDGDNRLLWRMSPRRMDIESFRDSLLAVTGELDMQSGGPSLPDTTNNKRRTLYAKVSRNGDVYESDRFLRRFDFPLMRATVAQRPNSIVPQQFLFLLNSDFMMARAKSLALQLHKSVANNQSGNSETEKIELAYRWLYQREPTLEEIEIGLQFIKTNQNTDHLSNWDRYAQVLLSANEFMYIR